MIKLGQKPPAPAVLTRKKITDALIFLRQQFATNGAITSDDFSKKSYWREVKKELSDYQHGKCCFCERGRDSNGESDVEHFRPKNARNGKPASGHHGYWWLAYNWDNLFFACKECNSKFKGNEFPLIDEASRAANESDNLSVETPIFFDLINENPETYIAYDWVGNLPLPTAKQNDPNMRAKKTIQILGLATRNNLALERAEKLTAMKAHVGAIEHYKRMGNTEMLIEEIEALKSHTNSKSKFSGFARYYYRSAELGQHIDE